MSRILIAFLLIFSSCSNDTPAETGDGTGGSVHANAQPTGVTGGKPFVLNGCYEMTLRQDTATLELTVKDTTVTGNLIYDWNEKDGNRGTIQGVIRDSLILADYTFESEGMTSVREVIFKIGDTALTEAFGELNTSGSKIVYADRSNLQFNDTYPFIKVACPPGRNGQ